MWTFIAGAMFGSVLGFLVCALVAANNRGGDCLNCDELMEREADLRAVTKSRDLLRDKCDQQELRINQQDVLIHGLRSKNGALSKEVQRTAYWAREGIQ